jgi:putative transposase
MDKERKVMIKEFINTFGIKNVDDLNEALKEMFSNTLENMLEAELDNHLGYTKYNYKNKSKSNSRNGHKEKKIISKYGAATIQVPRDCDSSFEPQVVPKREKDVSGIEDKVLSMYAKGISTREIADTLHDIYGVETSHETISRMVDKILPYVREWQARPLEPVYPFVYFDAMFVSVKDGARATKKAVYSVIGVDLKGRKDVLGLWMSETESAHFWLSVLDELKGRGVQDIFIACMDGLKGLQEAIEAVFPRTQTQRCIIHLIRNATKYVNTKERKTFCADLKKIYDAASKQAAETAFENLRATWGKTNPLAVGVWENNIDQVYRLFDFPQEIRKIIYTTNAVESYHSQLRKVSRGKAAFPNDEAVMKLFYLRTVDIVNKWNRSMKNWSQVLNQLVILFEDRVRKYLQ